MTLIDAVDKELEARPGVAPTQTLLFQQGLHMEPPQQGLGLLMVRSVHRPCHIDSLLVGRTFSQSFLVFYLNYTLDVALPLCFIPTLRYASSRHSDKRGIPCRPWMTFKNRVPIAQAFSPSYQRFPEDP
jgi:hypothetical protein